MTKTLKHGSLAALIFFSASSLPWSSCVGQTLLVGGAYGGVESWQESFYQNGTLVGQSSGSGSATFAFSYYSDGWLDFFSTCPSAPGLFYGFEIGSGAIDMKYGPTSASGSIIIDSQAATYGNFSATYESILPNGQIVVGDGGASANVYGDAFDQYGDGDTYAMQFTGSGAPIVPEPASIVPAALAVLMLVTFAWIRGFRLRSWLRLS